MTGGARIMGGGRLLDCIQSSAATGQNRIQSGYESAESRHLGRFRTFLRSEGCENER